MTRRSYSLALSVICFFLALVAMLALRILGSL